MNDTTDWVMLSQAAAIAIMALAFERPSEDEEKERVRRESIARQREIDNV